VDPIVSRLRDVLSIGKVGGGSGDPRYYIDNVAQGKEDYYSGRGESPGRWLGSSAAAAGLSGTVPRLALVADREPAEGVGL
jgi:hypothetical protein